MLYCNEERFVPTNINVMTIESNDGMFYYVHRSLYDQAVIINDRYKGKENELMNLIGRYENDEPTECVSFFHLVVPEPINILGYFLSLIDGYESMSQDIEVLCGAIHQMSAQISFRSMIGIPMELRAQVRFSLSIENEYKLSWDRFFQEALPYEEDMFLRRAEPVYVQQQPQIPQQVTPQMQAFLEAEENEEVFDWDSFVDDDILEEKEEPKIVVEENTSDDLLEEEVDDGMSLINSLI